MVYSSARYRAPVTTWKGWGGQNRREWTQKNPEGRYQLGARFSSAPVYLVGSLQQGRCLSVERELRAPWLRPCSMHRKARKGRAPLSTTLGGPNRNCRRYYTTHLSARTQAMMTDGGAETHCTIGEMGWLRRQGRATNTSPLEPPGGATAQR